MSSPRPKQRRPAPPALLPLILAAPASAAPAPVTAVGRGQVIEGALRHLQAA